MLISVESFIKYYSLIISEGDHNLPVSANKVKREVEDPFSFIRHMSESNTDTKRRLTDDGGAPEERDASSSTASSTFTELTKEVPQMFREWFDDLKKHAAQVIKYLSQFKIFETITTNLSQFIDSGKQEFFQFFSKISSSDRLKLQNLITQLLLKFVSAPILGGLTTS